MRTTGAVAVGMAAVTVCAAAAAVFARQTGPEADPLAHFQSAAGTYAALHRDVERHVAPLEISPDPRKIQQAVNAMGAAMRAARPSADIGDIFDAAARTHLRALIRDTLRERGHEPADVFAAIYDEGGAPGLNERPVVNGSFDWARGSFMPSCLLQVLPSLPAELEYRFVGRDLVLVDSHAGLVVDVLPDALPAGDFAVGGVV